MISISSIYEAEREIKEYYINLSVVKDKKSKLEFLEKQKIRVEADIKNGSITLESNIKSMDFGSEVVQQSKSKASVQEIALENAFRELERELERINSQIIELNTNIRSLETKIYDMTNIIKKLNDEARQILKFIYVDKKNSLEIGMLLNMSEPTVRRRKEKIIKGVSKWLELYKKT